MYNEAKFDITGNVGSITTVGTALKVKICANLRRRNRNGQWIDHKRWNTVTVFGAQTQKYIQDHVRKGDLVRATGDLGEDSYQQGAETVYVTTLNVHTFSGFGGRHAGDNERAEREDDYIPA